MDTLPNPPRILRRLGTPPRERCSTNATCPDVFELADGRFAVIGADVGVGPGGERTVTLPRDVMLAAARDMVQANAGG